MGPKGIVAVVKTIFILYSTGPSTDFMEPPGEIFTCIDKAREFAEDIIAEANLNPTHSLLSFVKESDDIWVFMLPKENSLLELAILQKDLPKEIITVDKIYQVECSPMGIFSMDIVLDEDLFFTSDFNKALAKVETTIEYILEEAKKCIALGYNSLDYTMEVEKISSTHWLINSNSKIPNARPQFCITISEWGLQ